MTDFKATSLTEHFKELKDPRIERTKRHLLGDIIVIAICAVICGADNWVEVEEFGRSKQEWLEKMLGLPHGIPSHDTAGRLASGEIMAGATAADDLSFGIPPEDLSIGGVEDADFAGVVYSSALLGDRIIYDVQVGGQLLKVKTAPTVHLGSRAQVGLRINRRRMHLFYGRTERRL